MEQEEDSLEQLLVRLKSANYSFVAVTPATHARVIARPLRSSPSLRDIFGWSRPFRQSDLDAALFDLLEQAGALQPAGDCVRSAVRVASLGGNLFLHSAFPTKDEDSVFFGPDTYRFARVIEETIARLDAPKWVVDVGAGSGAGGILAGGLARTARITLLDSNMKALAFARMNARAAGLDCEFLHSTQIPDGPDLIIANPPYLMDAHKRAYRDGGGLLGGAVALDWARQSLSSLADKGGMLLYTGVAFVDGKAPLLEALSALAEEGSARITIRELDPDIFGEELDEAAYADVERIAAVAVWLEKS
jgi:methylase of polypeptide subunit release factors